MPSPSSGVPGPPDRNPSDRLPLGPVGSTGAAACSTPSTAPPSILDRRAAPPAPSPSTGPCCATRLEEQGAKPATINHVLAALRGVVREAWRLDLIDAQVKERICDVKGIKADLLPKGRHVDAGEIRRLFAMCGDTPIGARDSALLALLYGCGLRRSEAVAACRL